MSEYLFVGEKRSMTAIDNDWCWSDERLCAIQLFAALRALDIEPEAQEFLNLWDDEGGIDLITIVYAQQAAEMGKTVVAMGERVHKRLLSDNVAHKHIIHPAARGKIRSRQNYINHVREVLSDET